MKLIEKINTGFLWNKNQIRGYKLEEDLLYASEQALAKEDIIVVEGNFVLKKDLITLGVMPNQVFFGSFTYGEENILNVELGKNKREGWIENSRNISAGTNYSHLALKFHGALSYVLLGYGNSQEELEQTWGRDVGMYFIK